VYESDEYQQVSNHNFQLLITSSHTVRQWQRVGQRLATRANGCKSMD
jgi:hypothetical protein